MRRRLRASSKVMHKEIQCKQAFLVKATAKTDERVSWKRILRDLIFVAIFIDRHSIQGAPDSCSSGPGQRVGKSMFWVCGRELRRTPLYARASLRDIAQAED